LIDELRRRKVPAIQISASELAAELGEAWSYDLGDQCFTADQTPFFLIFSSYELVIEQINTALVA
jgi:hypothetical protein